MYVWMDVWMYPSIYTVHYVLAAEPRKGNATLTFPFRTWEIMAVLLGALLVFASRRFKSP